MIKLILVMPLNCIMALCAVIQIGLMEQFYVEPSVGLFLMCIIFNAAGLLFGQAALSLLNSMFEQ